MELDLTEYFKKYEKKMQEAETQAEANNVAQECLMELLSKNITNVFSLLEKAFLFELQKPFDLKEAEKIFHSVALLYLTYLTCEVSKKSFDIVGPLPRFKAENARKQLVNMVNSAFTHLEKRDDDGHCDSCNGEGYKVIEGNKVTCSGCNGIGYLQH